LECDYLVVGAGAASLAFVDILLERTKVSGDQVSITIVDERDEPGGHWNDTYRFARLQHESDHYGVSSRRLEKRVRAKGSNGNHYASPTELLTYYGDVMDAFLGTGRVTFMPMCSFREDRVVSLTEEGGVWKLPAECKIVDSTFSLVQAPSKREPPFEVGMGAFVVPPDYLPSATSPPAKYCVIGAGRTGIDVVLWLLSRGVQPEEVQWIVPRDQWFQPREAVHGTQLWKTTRNFNEAIAKATSIEDMVVQSERRKIFCRLDPRHVPESFHGAAVSEQELTQLRRITDVVRLGHVRAVHSDHILLERGVVPAAQGTLFVDCTSSWIRNAREPVPIFQERRIVLQPVQEIFVGAGEFRIATSAALLGLLEGLKLTDDVKNRASTPTRCRIFFASRSQQSGT